MRCCSAAWPGAPGGVVTAAAFLHDVQAFARSPSGCAAACREPVPGPLPPLSVAFGAAVLRGQACLLPGDASAARLAALGLQFPGSRGRGGTVRTRPSPCPALPWCALLGTGAVDGATRRCRPGSLAAVVFTSGSTGTPVAHRKAWGALAARSRAAAAAFGMADGRTALRGRHGAAGPHVWVRGDGAAAAARAGQHLVRPGLLPRGRRRRAGWRCRGHANPGHDAAAPARPAGPWAPPCRRCTPSSRRQPPWMPRPWPRRRRRRGRPRCWRYSARPRSAPSRTGAPRTATGGPPYPGLSPLRRTEEGDGHHRALGRPDARWRTRWRWTAGRFRLLGRRADLVKMGGHRASLVRADADPAGAGRRGGRRLRGARRPGAAHGRTPVGRGGGAAAAAPGTSWPTCAGGWTRCSCRAGCCASMPCRATSWASCRAKPCWPC